MTMPRWLKCFVIALLIPVLVFGTDTGAQYGVSAANESTGDGNAWINTSNVLGASNYAQCTTENTGDATDYIKVTFSFSIPTDATIDGIQIDYNAVANTTNDMAEWGTQIMIGGTRVGTDLATESNYTTSAATYTKGGPTELWGLTPTATEVNSMGFSLYALDDGSGSGDWLRVYWVQATVYYTESGGEGEGEGEGETQSRGFFVLTR